MCNVIFQGCMSITQQAFALHNSYLVLICDAKTFVPQKRWRIVLDTGLTSCSDLAFDFVQKVYGCLKADFQRSWFHPWSPKKGKTVLDTGLSLCADQVFDFVQEMGDLKLTH